MTMAMIKMMVLKELNDHEQSGYDLMKNIGSSGNKPSPGYIYPLLRDLEKRGFISHVEEERRKVYHISKEGKKFLDNLKKTHEHAMNLMIKNFEPISTKKEVNEFLKFKTSIEQNKYKMMRDMAVLHKLRNAIFLIYEKDYEKKKIKLHSILKKTTQQLERLSKE